MSSPYRNLTSDEIKVLGDKFDALTAATVEVVEMTSLVISAQEELHIAMTEKVAVARKILEAETQLDDIVKESAAIIKLIEGSKL